MSKNIGKQKNTEKITKSEEKILGILFQKYERYDAMDRQTWKSVTGRL